MEKNLVIGVDVGGQSAKCGVVDIQGNVLAKTVIRSDTYTEAEPFVKDLASALKGIVKDAKAEGKIRGVGMGVPNGNFYTGEIENAVNLKWCGKGKVKFASMLQKELGGSIPVSLTNDANAAAMGEMTYGVAKGMKDFIMITLGTGVGSGIVINGQVVYGHDGFAGELGHTTIVRHNGRLCNCGKSGCLETYCSALGIARTAREWLEMSDQPSLLRNYDNITAKDVKDAASEGDELAKKIFVYTGTLLGEAFADFIQFSAPEAIILFGGVAKNREFMDESIRKAMNANVLPLWRNKVKLLYTALNESDAAILGASALAWDQK